MKWFGRIALELLGLIGLLLAVGMLLPSGFKGQRSVEVAAAPGRIYPLIADPREWKRWSVWNRRDPAMTMQYAGPPSGTGARWTWKSASEGNGEMEFTAAVPSERSKEGSLRTPQLPHACPSFRIIIVRISRASAGTRCACARTV